MPLHPSLDNQRKYRTASYIGLLW